MSPEEVYAALCISRNSNVNPCDWIASELPHLLDEICAMAVSVQQTYGGGEQRDGVSDISADVRAGVGGGALNGEVQLSRAEAKQAWLTAGGDTEKAVRQLLSSRQAKVIWIILLSRSTHPLKSLGGVVLLNNLLIQHRLDISESCASAFFDKSWELDLLT